LILRGARVLFPHSDLKLETEDQLVAVAAAADWAKLSEHLEPVARIRSQPPSSATPARR